MNDLKVCFRCEVLHLIGNFCKDKNRKDGSFSKDKNTKDGLHPQSRTFPKDFYLKNYDKIKKYNEQNRYKRNIYMKNRRETDVNSNLMANTGIRIYKSLKGMTKESTSRDILGIDIDTYRKCIEYQFTPEMNCSNIEIDHVKPIFLIDVSKGEELREVFNWVNTQPLLKEVHSPKGTNFNFLDYRLQFIKA